MENKYLNSGLTNQEVQERINKGLINKVKDQTSKTYSQIISSNILTLFNAINLFLAILVILTGRFRNILFMGVVICNTAIGIFQEIRAKRQLDKLRILNEPHAKVIREGKETTISSEEIVKDDLMVLSLGNQVLSDSILLYGDIALNESLLTGESNDVHKHINDIIYAGSFVTAGHAKVKVISVGIDNYINHILSKAKKEKKQPSKLRDALDFIVKSITIIILPLGLLLFLKQYYVSNISFNDAIIQTVASVVGMIPEGLVLLTSSALAIGALKLSMQKTLVQELYSLETLARVDTICFDKTGTITSGKIIIDKVIKYQDFDDNIIANIVEELADENATAKALRAYFKVSNKLKIDQKFPFSSKNKYSGATLNGDTYLMGAISFLDILNPDANNLKEIDEYTKNGFRVLAIVKNKELIGAIIMRDEIRKEAIDTIKYFYSQNLELKIISGDDAKTVSHIANFINIKNAKDYVDCSKISDEDLKKRVLEASVFGRVTPDQKFLMIETLKENGHTVAMVGDGVNDVMALKEADCSIAMFNGADSAKNTANIVLMDNDFSHMPAIVDEGRRVINNIQRTATLFLIKTVMSILLSILTISILKEYPFAPIQLTLVSSLCIGIPAFFLTFEPNYRKVSGNFLANILTKAIPSGITIVIIALILEVLANINIINHDHINTIYTFIMALIIIFNIYEISKPLSLLSKALIIFSLTGLTLAYLFVRDIFYFVNLDLKSLIIIFILSLCGILSLKKLESLHLADRFAEFIDRQY